MKGKVLWLIPSCLIVGALLLAACTSATTGPTGAQTVKGQITQAPAAATGTTTTAVLPAATTTPETVTPGRETMQNVWGETVDKPQYGGTITISGSYDYTHADPWFNWQGTLVSGGGTLEKLGIADYATPREEFDFTSYIPLNYIRGNIAESYEQPDGTTLIFHIRKGIRWHDKPPMNGRELDAYDVEFSFNRSAGLTEEFIEDGPSPFAHMINGLPLISIIATDKWTVEFKFSTFAPSALEAIYWESWEGSFIVPPEVIRQYGDMKDWRNVVGTGPWEIEDHVDGSSWTYKATPNYWQTDERHPGMKIPFADYFRRIIIPDRASTIAALRTGKIDNFAGLNFAEQESILNTNPYLKLIVPLAGGNGGMSAFNTTMEPFDQLKVRKAMQMALDLPTIVEDYYSGFAIATPYGIYGPAVQGYSVPFEEWPDDIKEGYIYNPEGAKALLAEAGYPNGFKFTYDTYAAFDNDLLQVFKSYWEDIGVETEINVLESYAVVYSKAVGGAQQLATAGYRATNYTIFGRTNHNVTGQSENLQHASSAIYDDLSARIYTEPDPEELRRLAKEIDLYYSSQHWVLFIPMKQNFTLAQPWIRGYWGQSNMGGGTYWAGYARFWIDQELKDSIVGR